MAWNRKILRVDLTKGTCKAEPLNMEWAQEYLGQRGLDLIGFHVLHDGECRHQHQNDQHSLDAPAQRLLPRDVRFHDEFPFR